MQCTIKQNKIDQNNSVKTSFLEHFVIILGDKKKLRLRKKRTEKLKYEKIILTLLSSHGSLRILKRHNCCNGWHAEACFGLLHCTSTDFLKLFIFALFGRGTFMAFKLRPAGDFKTFW